MDAIGGTPYQPTRTQRWKRTSRGKYIANLLNIRYLTRRNGRCFFFFFFYQNSIKLQHTPRFFPRSFFHRGRKLSYTRGTVIISSDRRGDSNGRSRWVIIQVGRKYSLGIITFNGRLYRARSVRKLVPRLDIDPSWTIAPKTLREIDGSVGGRSGLRVMKFLREWKFVFRVVSSRISSRPSSFPLLENGKLKLFDSRSDGIWTEGEMEISTP